MKKIILITLLVSFGVKAQTKGNKNIITKTFDIKNITSIKVNLYAKILVDQNLEEGLTITTDKNLFDKIAKEVVNGELNLDQISWIQPSKDIIVKIGAPNLKRLEQGTQDVTEINLNNEEIRLVAPLGSIVVKGRVENLSLGIENGLINASEAIAKNVKLNIWGYGKAKIYASNKVESKISKKGRLEIVNEPMSIDNEAKKAIARYEKIKNSDIQWINFTLKNNSWNRQRLFVVGPKKDGNKFSYGFSMMPGATRKENWTTGTKVYKVNNLGLRKLLVTVKAENESQKVNLFN